MNEIKNELQVAIKAARIGGDILLNYFGKIEHITEKHMAGLVSEADKASERAIQAELNRAFPEYDFLGEEMAYELGSKNFKITKPTWIVDPLDGTTNFIHRFPIFCVSIGLWVDNETRVGVIDVPILKETYSAWKGGGAFVNGQKLSVSSTKEIKNSLLATGFFNEDETIIESQIKIFSKIVRKARAVRRPGAAAYDLCQVSRGVFDLFWEKNLQPWDSAAGMLLVKEAGGVVKTYDGADYTPFTDSIVAGNPTLVNEFIQNIKSV